MKNVAMTGHVFCHHFHIPVETENNTDTKQNDTNTEFDFASVSNIVMSNAT